MRNDDATHGGDRYGSRHSRRHEECVRASPRAGEIVTIEKVRASPSAAKLLEPLWEHVMPGSLVLAPLSDRGKGWHEAIVQERHGNVMTLRWRNGLTSRAFTRTLKEIALLHPRLRFQVTPALEG